MKETTILIPTYNRPSALIVTLTGLLFQDYRDFDVIISDQSEACLLAMKQPMEAIIRTFGVKDIKVTQLYHLPPRGMAEQRQFLLDQVKTPLMVFVDDDLILEAYVMGNLVKAIHQEQCGFVGAAPIGLTYIDRRRPKEELIEFWEGGVQPEKIRPQSRKWQRYQLHNAANLYHVQEKLAASEEEPRLYKVAWVGGCVLYDTAKVRTVGGFQFWRQLPKKHCGEEVLVQLRLMERFGGCGILPSGVYHQELPTTITDRSANAPLMVTS